MHKISTFLAIFMSLFIGSVSYAQVTAVVTSPNPIPSSICNGDTIDFVAGNAVGNLTSFQWSFNGAAAGPQTLFGQNVQFIAGTAGAYVFDLIVSDGLILDTFSFNITVNPCTPPTIIISGTPTTVCEGTTVQFTDATTPGSQPLLSRQWVFQGGAPPLSVIATPGITYNVAGLYSVYFQVTDINGTYSDTLVDYISVVTCPLPVAEFVASNVQICPTDCINFLDQSLHLVPGQSTWSWSFPGSNTPVSIDQNPINICYDIPGIYDVLLTVTNANGSDSETKLAYIVVDSCTPPNGAYSVGKEKICKGTCVQFFNESTGDDSVLWHFFGANPLYEYSTESNPIVCYDDTGKFDVQFIAFNIYGPSTPMLDVDKISVKDFPKVQAPPDTSVLIGNSVKLIAFGEGNGFRWTPDYNVDCAFCSQTLVSPTENTQYFITNINENGCESTDSVIVIVIKEYYRGIPDAFTPNGDGENDDIRVFGNGITYLELYIYDRHGNIVFETRDQEFGWDGTLDGEDMEAGVYAYFAKITYISGYQEVLKGNVTLVR